MQESGQQLGEVNASQSSSKIQAPPQVNQRNPVDSNPSQSVNQKQNEKDFQAAYKSLQKEIIQKEMSGNNENAKLISQQHIDDYVKGKDQPEKGSKAYKRLYNEAQHQQKKKNEAALIQVSKEEEELKDCTFKPRLYTANNQKRTKDEFLMSQQKFLEGKQEKLRQKQEQKLDDEIGDVVKKKSNMSQQEWMDRFTKKDEKKIKYEDPNTTFQPKIDSKTQKILSKKGERKSAFEGLTQDSKNRQEKEKLAQGQKGKTQNVKAQDKSIKILHQKLDKEFNTALEELKQNLEEDQEGVTEEMFVDALQSMGFIDKNQEKEEQLAKELFQVVQEKPTQKNCLVILCHVEKIQVEPAKGKEKQDEEEEEDKAEFGSFNDKGEFVVSEVQSVKLAKKFGELREKRQRGKLEQVNKKKLESEKPNFKPNLDKNSQKILEKKQKSNPQNVDKATELIQRGKQYQEKRDKLAKEKVHSEVRNISFKPKLLSKYDKAEFQEKRSPDTRKKDQIFEELYKKKDKKDDVHTIDVEFEKNKDQCTFKPDITRLNMKGSPKKRESKLEKEESQSPRVSRGRNFVKDGSKSINIEQIEAKGSPDKK